MACNGFNPAVSGASNCLASCTPADLFANSQGPNASCLNAGAPTSPALTAALVPLLHTTLTHSSACPPPRRHGVDGTRHSACPPPHRAEGSLWGRASAAAWHCPCPATPRGCSPAPAPGLACWLCTGTWKHACVEVEPRWWSPKALTTPQHH